MKHHKAPIKMWPPADGIVVVTVEAVSKRGKQLIQCHGDRWRICEMRDKVSCFNHERGMLIVPEGFRSGDAESRWVRATDWLRWTDHNLRPTEASILEWTDIPPFTPVGSEIGFTRSRVSPGNEVLIPAPSPNNR